VEDNVDVHIEAAIRSRILTPAWLVDTESYMGTGTAVRLTIYFVILVFRLQDISVIVFGTLVVVFDVKTHIVPAI
jgi:hypothetical protein